MILIKLEKNQEKASMKAKNSENSNDNQSKN